jgi:hypothetical protein
MRLAVIGLWHLGTVTAACTAAADARLRKYATVRIARATLLPPARSLLR